MEGNNQNLYKEKGALDAFLNLLSLVTLGWMSLSLGGVLFQIINKFFSPNLLFSSVSNFSQTALKFNVASTLIITPVFLAVISLLHKKYRKEELNHTSGIYRWLTYLMLFVSALVLIGDLIAVVFRLLDGDYTLSVFLKIIVILLIAGGIFGYYFYDLKRKSYNYKSAVSVAFLVAIIIVALASVLGSFFIIDSPQKSRERSLDLQRASDLTSVSSQLASYYIKDKKLPSDLAAANITLADPETKKPYDYQVFGDGEYALCATFSLASNNPNEPVPGKEWYSHGAGYQCFNVKLSGGNLQVGEPGAIVPR
ncbi:MAG: DUF5671 domain-containing protein [Patescibacteria group bacterium]